MPSARTPSPTVALSTAVALAAAAGCGGAGPGAQPAPGPVGAVVAPSAGAGNPPGDSHRATLAAVSRVAKRYYAALDHLRVRMDPAPVAALIAPDCPCRAQVRAIEAAIRRGERYTDRVRVRTLLPHLDQADRADVVVSVDVRRGGLLDAAGRRIGAATTTYGVHRELMLRRIGRRWLIERVVAV